MRRTLLALCLACACVPALAQRPTGTHIRDANAAIIPINHALNGRATSGYTRDCATYLNQWFAAAGSYLGRLHLTIDGHRYGVKTQVVSPSDGTVVVGNPPGEPRAMSEYMSATGGSGSWLVWTATPSSGSMWRADGDTVFANVGFAGALAKTEDKLTELLDAPSSFYTNAGIEVKTGKRVETHGAVYAFLKTAVTLQEGATLYAENSSYYACDAAIKFDGFGTAIVTSGTDLFPGAIEGEGGTEENPAIVIVQNVELGGHPEALIDSDATEAYLVFVRDCTNAGEPTNETYRWIDGTVEVIDDGVDDEGGGGAEFDTWDELAAIASGTLTQSEIDALVTRDSEWDTWAEIAAASSGSLAETELDSAITRDTEIDTWTEIASLASGTLGQAELDALVTRDAEWDSWAEIASASSGSLAESELDAALTRDSEIDTWTEIAALATGQLSEADVDPAVTRDSEWDSWAEIASASSGTLSEAEVDSAIARDSEVTALTNALDARLDDTEADLESIEETRITGAKYFIVGDPDSADENTAMLLTLSALRRPIDFPAGAVYFADIDESTTNMSIFDQYAWYGAAAEAAWQHIEEEGLGQTPDDQSLTRFMVVGMDVDDVWLDMEERAAVRTGPFRHENLVVIIPAGEEGSLFSYGDEGNQNGGVPSCRGLYFKNCYLSFEDHLAGSYIVRDSANDWRLNKVHGTNFAVRGNRVYDGNFENLYLRGWWKGLINEWADRPRYENVRSGTIGWGVDHFKGVPAHCAHVWSEGVWVQGGNWENAVHKDLYHEGGYDDGFEPDIGDTDVAGEDPRKLPPGIDFDVSIAGDYLQFDLTTFPGGTPGSVPGETDLDDYLEERTVIRLTDSVAGVERELYIDEIEHVSATVDRLHFRNAGPEETAHSYFRNALTDAPGDSIVRTFGHAGCFVGDVTSVDGHSLSINHARTDLPIAYIVPGKLLQQWSGNHVGTTLNTGDLSTRVRVCMATLGGTFAMGAGAYWEGPDPPIHPCVVQPHEQPIEYDGNLRDMVVERVYDGGVTVLRHIATPGRGWSVSGPGDTGSRLHLFDTRVDTAYTPDRSVPVIEVTTARAWRTGNLTRSGVTFDYSIRLWSSGSANLRIRAEMDGDFESTPHAIVSGWQTITGSMTTPVTDQRVDLYTDSGTAEITRAEFYQDELP